MAWTRCYLFSSAVIVTGWLLAGCGAEVAQMAATTAALQSRQAQQAKAQQQQFNAQLGEAMKAVEASASAAAQE